MNLKSSSKDSEAGSCKNLKFIETVNPGEKSHSPHHGGKWVTILFESGCEFADKKRSGREIIFQRNWTFWRSALSRVSAWSHDPLPGSPRIHAIPPPSGNSIDKTGKPKLSGGFVTKLNPLKKVLQLDHLLSTEECAAFVEGGERAGFMEVGEIASLDFPEYVPSSLSKQRNTARVMLVEDPGLALLLWDRVQHIVMQYLPVITYADNEGGDSLDLHATGVCPLMRVLKYEQGQQFLPHTDGVDYSKQFPASKLHPVEETIEENTGELSPVSAACSGDSGHAASIRSDSKDSSARSPSSNSSRNLRGRSGSLSHRSGKFRSGLTLAIYLNEGGSTTSEEGHSCSSGEYTGGSIRFLHPPRLVQPGSKEVSQELPALSRVYEPYTPPVEIQPAQGQGLLFEQDENHEGMPLLSGTKYMIQTSIMYEIME